MERPRLLKQIPTELALLAIELGNREIALLASRRSGAWFQQYVAALYRHREPIVHAGLRDRQLVSCMPREGINLGILDYRSPDGHNSKNLGDYIQTLAVLRQCARFFGQASFRGEFLQEILAFLAKSWTRHEQRTTAVPVNPIIVDRDYARTDIPLWLPFFGWFGQRPFGAASNFDLPPNIHPLFFSVHLTEEAFVTPGLCDRLKAYEPIGCRDRNTCDWLASAGVKAFVSGCITTTLALPNPARVAPPVRPLYPRGNRYQVDDLEEGDENAIRITHSYPYGNDTFTQLILRTLDLLLAYRQAQKVSTSRLHCYLPCRALGVPVTLKAQDPKDPRLDGLVGIDKEQFAAMRYGLTNLLERMFHLIFSGADTDTIYRAWREQTLPLVAWDEARRKRYAPLFTRNRETSAAHPEPKLEDHIPVALAFDANLVTYVPNLLSSIAANTTRRIDYHLMVRGVSDRIREELEALFPGNTLHWHVMDGVLSRTRPLTAEHITVSTMDRLRLPDLLPHVDKIIYLDIDMIVLADLAELYETPMKGRPLAACQGLHHRVTLVEEVASRMTDPAMARAWRRACGATVSIVGPAFNAGVLVLSLDAMRRDQFCVQMAPVIDMFGIDDQIMLNIYAGDDFVLLEKEWNVIPRCWTTEGAKIVHWAGSAKPWHTGAIDSRLWRQFSSPSSSTYTSHRGSSG